MNTETKATAELRSDFYSSLVPYGYMDVTATIDTAIESGHTAQWAGELISEKAEEYGMTVDKLDPVCCVYEAILGEFRGELEEKTGFDFENDSEAKTGLYVAGNFMCTSFDYSEEAKEEIINVLKENKVDIEDFDEASKFVLSALDITQETITA